MNTFLTFLKAFFVDVIVTAGFKIWEMVRRGAKHHESYSDGKTEENLKDKIKDQWGDNA